MDDYVQEISDNDVFYLDVFSEEATGLYYGCLAMRPHPQDPYQEPVLAVLTNGHSSAYAAATDVNLAFPKLIPITEDEITEEYYGTFH